MATDTKIPQLIINEMTRAQYEALTEVSESEIYVITDDETTVVTSGTTIVGDGSTSNPISLSNEVITKIDNNTTNLSSHTSNESNPHKVTKDQVGLGKVDNTSDINKPISVAQQAALDLKANKSTTYTKTEVDNLVNTKLNISDAESTYATAENLQNHIDDESNPHNVTKAQIGLGNVDNTSDLNKPISTATQAALDLKANQSTTYTKTETDGAIETALEDYVKNTDYAGQDTAGVIKTSSGLGMWISTTGYPLAVTATKSEYDSANTTYFVGKGTLENIKDDYVKRGVTENTITLTDTEKESARTWIGAGSQEDVTSIESKIPSTASSTNLLADRDFVNSSINNLAAFYLTSNITGDAFSTKAALVVGPYYFQGELRTPTLNDYAIVIADETKENASTRYLYDGTQWDFQYIINNTPFTQEQVNAINSTITATLVGQYNTHIANKENPHGVTATQIGLGNVNNTSDLDKPISTATQTALDNHTNNKSNPHEVTKAQVGLGNVDNTSDLDKPISTATQEALDLKANADEYVKKSGDTMSSSLYFPVDGKSGIRFTTGHENLNPRIAATSSLKISISDKSPDYDTESGFMFDLANGVFYHNNNNFLKIGRSDRVVKNIYTSSINNGADLVVPTEAGTLARIEDIPVSSVNSKTGEVVLNTEDINATNGEETITLQAALDLKANQSTTYTKIEVDNKIAEFEAFPDQTNNSGKILTTNGTETSWTGMPGLIIRRL